MANIAIFRINYKSDFILTLNSDAGWLTPFCIKFWTCSPAQAYYASYDGETYTNCEPVEGEPTKIQVQFDDHHLPIGNLKFQIGYHFTIADFPTTVEDEVLNQAAVIIEKDGEPAQVMLDFNGETAPEIQFSLPAYANEAQRIANEETRIEAEQQRITEFAHMEDVNAAAVAGAMRVNAHLEGTILTVTDRDGHSVSSDVQGPQGPQGEQGAQGERGPQGEQGAQGERGPQGEQGAQGERGPQGEQGAQGERGPQGEQGAQGERGPQGEQGAQGERGPQGVQGAQGERGPQGEQGPQGERGPQGEQGPQGERGPQGDPGVYDISEAHASGGVLAKYANLTAALGPDGANIPSDLRKGGMSVKFVQSSDNKYLQYRLIKDEWSTNVLDWENTGDTIGILKSEYNSGSIALNLIPNCYIDTDGEPQPLPDFYATDFIAISSSRLKLYFPFAQRGNFSSFYNENKEQISNFMVLRGNNIIDIPEGAAYFRTTIAKGDVNDTIIYSETEITTKSAKKIGLEVLDFIAGYYDLSNGTKKPVGTTRYHRSQIVPCSNWRTLKGIEQLTEASDYVALWLNGVYVGYEFPANGETSLSYNQVACVFRQNLPNTPQRAINIWTNPFYNAPSEQTRYSHLQDKKIGFLGDSITYGVGASNRNTTSYVALMKKEFDTVMNYGISSTYIEEMTGRDDAMCDRYANMSDDLDIVVVYGGTNDWYYGEGWGTVDSVDKTTFLGALNVLMSGLVEKYCGKEIFFVTPMSSDFNGYNTDNPNQNTGKTMLDYRNAIIERAAYHGIPVIDLYGMCGMDVAHNAANKTYYSSDGVHPNDAGHKRIHDRIVAFISNILY